MFFYIKAIGQNNINDSTLVFFLDSLKEFKIEKTFFATGKIKTEKTYYGNKMIRIIYYSKESKPLIESNYNLNEDEFGWQKEYYENGKIKKEKFIVDYTIVKEKYKKEIFNVKVFNGSYREYYDNGMLKKEGCIINGKKQGLEISYDLNSSPTSINYYKNTLKR